jgi:hypothetical protein
MDETLRGGNTVDTGCGCGCGCGGGCGGVCCFIICRRYIISQTKIIQSKINSNHRTLIYSIVSKVLT